MLDYGCGAGEAVRAGFARGLDIYGCDPVGASGGRIVQMLDGRIPFPDSHFDFIFHNQVMEHVQDIDLALSELRRALKPSGAMLSLFPTLEVLREGHCGIALAHRLHGRPRRAYLRSWRALGFGSFKEGKTQVQWVAGFEDFLDHSCAYRTRAEVCEAYARHGFSVEPLEVRYAEYRLRTVAPVARAVPRLTTAAIRLLGGNVFLSHPKQS